jgi:ubiquitin-protein ligase
MTNWSVQLAGPRGTVYENGIFQLVVTFPPEYPFKPFQINFNTRIYHPNVTNDSLGSICLAALKPDEYKPNKHVRAVLEDVKGLLERPNPDDPLEPRIADEYVKDRKEFEKSARNYVARYAAAPGTAATGSSSAK